LSGSLRRAALAVVVAGTLQGCSLTLDARSLGVPVTMASPVGQAPDGDRFRVTSRAIYGFWGLARIKQVSLSKSLATQLAGGRGVADLKINTHSSFGDVLITVLTAGLVVPRAVTFEGVVTR
jgi:hypothetical protein